MNKKMNLMINKVVSMMIMVFCFTFIPALKINAQESAPEEAPNISGTLQLESFAFEITPSENEGSEYTVNLLPVFSGDMGDGRYLLRITADDVSGQAISPTKRFDASGSLPSSCLLNTSKLSEDQTFVVALYKEDFDQQYLIVNSLDGTLVNDDLPSENVTDFEEVESDVAIPGCQHEFEYMPYKDATVDSDALLVYTCMKCGEETKYTEIPNSAYAAFLMESIKAVKSAAVNNDTNIATIRTDRWISFNYAVLSSIAENPDVTVCVEFLYHGEAHSFTIPAGTDILSLADENGYAGFLFLEQEMGSLNS